MSVIYNCPCAGSIRHGHLNRYLYITEILSVIYRIGTKQKETIRQEVISTVSRKSVITFGMVAIPIAMYVATQDNDIHFNQLHKEDNTRVQYKKICAHCGKEIRSEDIVKGFEYDKGKYVVITDEEIEKIKTEKEKAIQILHFAQLNQISPVYYDKTYQAAPEAGGEKAFELLRAALMAEQKIAIGKTVMGTRDTLMAIIPVRTVFLSPPCSMPMI